MTLDYTKRKEDKDKVRQMRSLEKQKVLQQAVDKDLQIYKQTGFIASMLNFALTFKFNLLFFLVLFCL